jgi:hypothetical protein
MISSFIDRLMPDHLKKSLLVDTAIIKFYDDFGRIPSPLEIQALLYAHNANLSLNSRTPITPLSFKNSFQRLRPAPLQRQLNVETSIDFFYCTVDRLPTEDDVVGLLIAYNETLHANSQALMTSTTFKTHMRRCS